MPSHGATNACVLLCYVRQITSKDKDFRFMAASDLLSELQKESFKVRARREGRC